MSWLTVVFNVLRYCLRGQAVRTLFYVVGGLIVLPCVFALVWWSVTVREAEGLRQEIDGRRAEMMAATRADELSRMQTGIQKSLSLLESKLSSTASQADLIRGISHITERHHLRVLSQSFEEGKGQGNESALYLELTLQGSYTSLRGLMSDLASLPMWIEIVEARLDRTAGSEVRAQLRLLTYRTPKGRS